MKYRLKKYKQGWIVEYEKCMFFGLIIKWKHVTHWAGMADKPFYYKTPDAARDGALNEIKDDINFSFYHPQFY